MTNYKKWSKPRAGLMFLMALLSTILWMGQVNAGAELNSNVPFAVNISGPSSIDADQQGTYIMSYSGVASTGGVKYYPPSGFTITSVSPANNSSSGTTLIWTSNASGSNGTITINGQYNSSSCISGNSPHVGEVYDTHGPGSTDTHLTTVSCGIATNTPTVTATTTVTPTVTATTPVTPTVTATTPVTPTVAATATITPTIAATATVTPTIAATATPSPGTINGTVFNDLNANGIQNTGEEGIAGVTVTLDGTTTTTTDANGNYSFTDVPAGRHTVMETDLTNYVSTTLNNVPVNVTSAGTAVANFGDILQGTVSGGVFNVNGTGIAGVTVELLDSSGNVVASITTGSNGSYSFANVNAGVYKVRVSDPAGFIAVSSNTKTATIGTDGTATVNFIYQSTGTISGLVFNDSNRNGILDGSEGGIIDITVTLSDGSTTTTNAIGYYEFSNVPTSDTPYNVTINTPTNGQETTENPVSVPITSDSPSSTASFGLANLPADGTGTIAGRFCFDLNGDGYCSQVERGLTVRIILILLDGRSPDGGGQLEVTTDAEGNYVFENVPIGSYRLLAQPVDNTVATTPLEIPVSVGDQQSTSVQFGVAPSASVSGVVFADTDGNGSQSDAETGLAGIEVKLMSGGAQVATTTTNINGQYQFDNIESSNSYNAVITVPDSLVATTATDQSIAPGSSANFGLRNTGTLSGVVYRDQNGNGTLDDTEVGLNGATIELSNGMSTVSNGDGVYEFTGLVAGDYTVTETDPPGFVSTSNMMTVTIAENGSASANFADRRANRVGGKVFNDLDGNGTQDSGEAGFGGATVELRNVDGTVVATTTSLASGTYEFLNVANGDYTVVVSAPTGFEGTTPTEVSATVTDSASPVANFGLRQGQVPNALLQPSLNEVMPTTEPFWLALLLLSTVAGLAFYRMRFVK